MPLQRVGRRVSCPDPSLAADWSSRPPNRFPEASVMAPHLKWHLRFVSVSSGLGLHLLPVPVAWVRTSLSYIWDTAGRNL